MVTKQECFGCGRKPTARISYDGRKYCDVCFMKMIVKRVRKDIRSTGLISSENPIVLLNDRSREYKIAKLVLKSMYGAHLTIKEVKKADENTIIPTSLEREATRKISAYLENTKNPEKRKTLLHNVLDKELAEICRIKKINPCSGGEDSNSLIEDVAKLYPETKFGLAKSMRDIFEK